MACRLSASRLRPPEIALRSYPGDAAASSADSNACHRGMHLRSWFVCDGSRVTNSRRRIAPIDFRRSSRQATQVGGPASAPRELVIQNKAGVCPCSEACSIRRWYSLDMVDDEQLDRSLLPFESQSEFLRQCVEY